MTLAHADLRKIGGRKYTALTVKLFKLIFVEKRVSVGKSESRALRVNEHLLGSRLRRNIHFCTKLGK